jgi:hypothetical protein
MMGWDKRLLKEQETETDTETERDQRSSVETLPPSALSHSYGDTRDDKLQREHFRWIASVHAVQGDEPFGQKRTTMKHSAAKVTLTDLVFLLVAEKTRTGRPAVVCACASTTSSKSE